MNSRICAAYEIPETIGGSQTGRIRRPRRRHYSESTHQVPRVELRADASLECAGLAYWDASSMPGDTGLAALLERDGYRGHHAERCMDYASGDA